MTRTVERVADSSGMSSAEVQTGVPADGRSFAGGPVGEARKWPAWQVPRAAEAAWAELQKSIEEMVDAGRAPACVGRWGLWGSARSDDQAEAAEACSWCPLLEACRSYAIEARESEGVWGGLTPRDRARRRTGAAS